MSVNLNQRGEEAHMLSTTQVDENWAMIEAAINEHDLAIEAAINAVDGTLKKPPILKGESNTGTQAYFTAFTYLPATYLDLVGYLIFLKPDTTNTSSAATLRVAPIVTGGSDGSGNVNIRKNHDKLIEAGDIRAGKWSIFFTDGTVFVLLNPGSAAKGNYDGTVPNGSFEVDSDADGVPDEWTRVLPWAGGSFAIETTDVMHGTAAIKFTHPGGAGNGGGYAESGYLECTEKRALMLQWLHKSSAAGMFDKVELFWFDRTKTALTSPNNLTAIYSSTANPTSWTLQQGAALPPATARYFKIRLTGGDSSNATGGTSFWDDVRFVETGDFAHEVEIDATTTWTSPTLLAFVTSYGAGGGGGGNDNSPSRNGGGGGAGGVAQGWVPLTVGQAVTCTIGAGGTGGAGTGNGTTGGATSFSTFIAAAGGSGGVGGSGAGSGAGGAGGAGSGTYATRINTGSAGSAGGASNSTGGNGGGNTDVGLPGATGTTSNGAAGAFPCAGGAGSGDGGSRTGGAGKAGKIAVRWWSKGNV